VYQGQVEDSLTGNPPVQEKQRKKKEKKKQRKARKKDRRKKRCFAREKGVEKSTNMSLLIF